MSDLFERIRAAREHGAIDVLVERIPYARFLGIDVELGDGGEVITSMRYADHLIGNSLIPALHGGTIGSLLESAAIFTLLWSSESTGIPKTINITVQFLRTGKPEDTFARAEITKAGRRVVNVQAFAWQGDERDRPIASATMHFLLPPLESP